MMRGWLHMLTVIGAISVCVSAAQEPVLRITWPPADSIVSGATRLEAAIAPTFPCSRSRFS